MKIFLSYGRDSNAPLIEKIKEYLLKDVEGNTKHEVWIDTSEIKAGKDDLGKPEVEEKAKWLWLNYLGTCMISDKCQ